MSEHALAVFFAALLPLALLITRWSLRRQRGARVNDLMRALYGPEGAADGQSINPQIEIVRAKYDSHDEPLAGGVAGAVRHSLFTLLVAAVMFGTFSWLFFELLFMPTDRLAEISGSVLFQNFPPPPKPLNLHGLIVVAFLGAYVGTALYLARAALNFELDALAFVRATVQGMLGVVVAIVGFEVLWTAVQSYPSHGLRVAFGGAWLAVAFLLGLAPESGLGFVMRRVNLRLRKATDQRALNAAAIAPVELIDGVDSDIAHRLQESNVYDVQNLATVNPIQLFVETPYSLFECFDWVSQAQLCLVVGPGVFQELKKHNIRTIFDLERAVLAWRAPDTYVAAIGELLFSRTPPEFVARLRGPNDDIDPVVVRHAVAVMGDDLHVHRMRSLWTQIRERVSSGREWLLVTGPLPGDPDIDRARGRRGNGPDDARFGDGAQRQRPRRGAAHGNA